MIPPAAPGPLALAAGRRALEAAFGLALEGLSEEQIALALRAAGPLPPPGEPGEQAWLARAVDALPIDESWLFRDDGLWDWLREAALPEALDRAAAEGRPVRVLSLGCSAGQEPFSAALLLLDLLEQRGIPASAAGAFARVTGVDGSPARVEAARGGTVPSWSVQRCRPDRLRGRVRLEDAATGRHRVDGAATALCRFEVGNLVEWAARAEGALGGHDLVLCRNVLIYFRAAEGERIVRALAGGLDRGALLALSAPEAHLLEGAGLEPAGHLGVGRRGAPAALAPGPARRRGATAGRARAVAPAPRPTPAPAPAAAAAGAADPARGAGRSPARAAAADEVAVHVGEALRHASAGRTGEVLRAARAALFHDPRHLYSRLLLGQALIPVDRPRGREVLEALVAAAARLPADAAVPCAEGLSVGQLASAARLLLDRPEGA